MADTCCEPGICQETASPDQMAGFLQRLELQAGRRFFETLLSELFILIDGTAGFVAARLESNECLAETLLFLRGRETRPNLVYAIAGTPCELVIEEGRLVIETGLSDLFPHDALVRRLGVDGYAGVLLRDERDSAVGWLVVMSARPMTPASWIVGLLDRVSERVVDEIRRIRSAEQIRKEDRRGSHRR